MKHGVRNGGAGQGNALLPLDGGTLRARFWLDVRLNSRAYLFGLLLVLTGWIAGGAAVGRLTGEALRAYETAAAAALLSMKQTPKTTVVPLLRALWVNGSACALVASGGVGGAMTAFSALMLLLFSVPQGCAFVLLWRQGGGLCAGLCVALPSLALLFVLLKYWTLALAGASAARAGQPLSGYGGRLLRCAPLLLLGVLLQGWLCPLLFRTICALTGA